MQMKREPVTNISFIMELVVLLLSHVVSYIQVRLSVCALFNRKTGDVAAKDGGNYSGRGVFDWNKGGRNTWEAFIYTLN